MQARLAQEEVAASQKPAWKHALARWSRAVTLPRLAGGGLVLAAAITLVFVKTRPHEDEMVSQIINVPSPDIKPGHGPTPPTAPVKTAPTSTASSTIDDDADVSADLAAEPARITTRYLREVDEVVLSSKDLKWSDDRRAAFDAKIATMRAAVQKAPEGKPRRRAAEALLAFAEGAVIREDVVLASNGGGR